MRPLRLIVTMMVAAASFTSALHAQAATTDSAKKAKAETDHAAADTAAKKVDKKDANPNYAVPDAPALTLVSGDASTLLRPASVEALTTSFSNAEKGGFGIPNAFAVEFSPLMLFRQSLSLSEYRAHPEAYRFRLSAASKKDTSAGARPSVGFGARVSLFDDADLRTNDQYIMQLQSLTDLEAKFGHQLRDSLAKDTLPAHVDAATPAAVKARVDAITEYFATRAAAAEKDLIAQVKKATEDTTWNGNKLDVAYGALLSSTDSLGHGTTIMGHSGWLTYAHRMSGMELLLGGNAKYSRDSLGVDLKFGFGGGGRLYIGGNDRKLSADLEASKKGGGKTSCLAQLGAEIKVASSLWATFGLGWKADSLSKGSGRMVTNFNLSMKPPS